MSVAMRSAALGLLTCFTLGASAAAYAGAGCKEACNARGRLLDHRVTLTLSAAAFSRLLASNEGGRQIARIAGAPACGVEIVTFRYRTIGGAGEPTNASGALMIPVGRSAACRGARPLMLYAHGTSVYRNYNLADITQTDPGNGDGAGEGISVAAMYAAQGYLVVATNYAGYAGSDLPYHPYLNADQQSADVIDSLHAARVALAGMKPAAGAHENGKLFVTGYSQGGFVAMATHRALQAAGVKVTASAPGSGPYALAATADALIEGEVNLGATLFTTLTVTGYQCAYENIYRKPGDFYEAAYAPASKPCCRAWRPLNYALTAKGNCPSTHLFNSEPPAPQFASMTPPHRRLCTPSALTPLVRCGIRHGQSRAQRVSPELLEDAAANPDGAFPNPLPRWNRRRILMHPLRQAFKRNDLRNWLPSAPVLMCGGARIPRCFFSTRVSSRPTGRTPRCRQGSRLCWMWTLPPPGPMIRMRPSNRVSRARRRRRESGRGARCD